MRKSFVAAAALGAVTGWVVFLDATVGVPGGVLDGRLLRASSPTVSVSQPQPQSPAASESGSAAPSGSPSPSESSASAAVLAPAAGATAPDPEVLAARLGVALSPDTLGSQIAASVIDMVTGEQLYAKQAERGLTPASTTKLLTAAAALDLVGPTTRLETTVVESSAAGPGSWPTTITLVGGGDPSLRTTAAPGEPSLKKLARQVWQALIARDVQEVRLRYDASLFSRPAVSKAWPSTYVSSGVVSPVAALSVDEARALDPPREAALAFEAALERAGISVRGQVSPARGPTAGDELAAVRSQPVSVLLQRMLTDSDNDFAEAFGHLVAVAAGEPATFAGGARATIAAVADLGVPTEGVRLNDASGLARTNRIPAETLARLLVLAGSDRTGPLGTVLPGLPVAGFTGTLTDRFLLPPAKFGAGVVRAKTGSLTGVAALAGTVQDREGRVLAFAFVADRTQDTLEARATLDRAAALLARCGCR